jgi:hypothetical protein
MKTVNKAPSQKVLFPGLKKLVTINAIRMAVNNRILNDTFFDL